jgi:hypothetical protein
MSRNRSSIAQVSVEVIEDDPLGMEYLAGERRRRKSSNYLSYDGCMEGEAQFWCTVEKK